MNELNFEHMEKQKNVLKEEAEQIARRIEACMRVVGEYHSRRVGFLSWKLANWMEHKSLLVWAMPAGEDHSLYRVWHDKKFVMEFRIDHYSNRFDVRAYIRGSDWLELVDELEEKVAAIKKVKQIKREMAEQKAVLNDYERNWGIRADDNR